MECKRLRLLSIDINKFDQIESDTFFDIFQA